MRFMSVHQGNLSTVISQMNIQNEYELDFGAWMDGQPDGCIDNLTSPCYGYSRHHRYNPQTITLYNKSKSRSGN